MNLEDLAKILNLPSATAWQNENSQNNDIAKLLESDKTQEILNSLSGQNENSQNLELVSGLLNPNQTTNPERPQSIEDFPEVEKPFSQGNSASQQPTAQEIKVTQAATGSQVGDQKPQINTAETVKVTANPEPVQGLLGDTPQLQQQESQLALYPKEILNYSQNDYVQGILQAKENHAALTNKLKETESDLAYLNSLESNPEQFQKYLKDNNITAEQFAQVKSNTQSDIDNLNKQRDRWNMFANMFRGLFREAGGTDDQLAYYGADRTLEQATDALDINNRRALNDLIGGKYSMSTEEYFNQRFNDYRRQGRSRYDSEYLASEDALKYQVERRDALNQGLSMYGRTDGLLNDYGMDIEKLLALDNPMVANIDLNSYALPKNEYQNDFQSALAKFNNAASLEKLLQQQIGQMDLAEYNKQMEALFKQWEIAQRQAEEQGRNTRHNDDRYDKYALAQYRNQLDKELAEFQEIVKNVGRKNLSDDETKDLEEKMKHYKDLLSNAEKYGLGESEVQEYQKEFQIASKYWENIKNRVSTTEIEPLGLDNEKNKAIIDQMKANGWDKNDAAEWVKASKVRRDVRQKADDYIEEVYR